MRTRLLLSRLVVIALVSLALAGAAEALLSDFRRQMLPAYGAMQTDPNSPVYRYGKRAYFIVDRTGAVTFIKVMDNALELLDPEEVLKALKAAS
jgi:peroxiredoxin